MTKEDEFGFKKFKELSIEVKVLVIFVLIGIASVSFWMTYELGIGNSFESKGEKYIGVVTGIKDVSAGGFMASSMCVVVVDNKTDVLLGEHACYKVRVGSVIYEERYELEIMGVMDNRTYMRVKNNE